MSKIKLELKVLYAMRTWLKKQVHFVLIILSRMLSREAEKFLVMTMVANLVPMKEIYGYSRIQVDHMDVQLEECLQIMN